jgi:segregation and condensation protein B
MATNFYQQLETLLFVAGKPLAMRKLVKLLNTTEEKLQEALTILRAKYLLAESGIVLMQNNDEWQLVSHPENRALAEQLVKAELTGELTRPQLETLTVISYCGPITKPELEQIRGVNCSLILRNLMMRGLVKEVEADVLLPRYEVTMEYLQHIGITNLNELPDYATLHKHEFITQALIPPVAAT